MRKCFLPSFAKGFMIAIACVIFQSISMNQFKRFTLRDTDMPVYINMNRVNFFYRQHR